MKYCTLPLLMTASLLAIPASVQANPDISKVFSGDMLGTNLRYFESIAGIARESWGDEHHYVVNGCAVRATVGGDRVHTLRMEVGPECQVDLTSFIGESFAPPANQPLTFGTFTQAAGEPGFYADCLISCGNASDPTIYAHWEGPRAANFLEVALEAMLIEDDAIQASNKWSDAMTKGHGEDWVMMTGFNCDRTYDEYAQQYFSSIKVSAVTIGHELYKPGC